MLLGTHSSAGKSVLTTAFCRILAREGVSVAPFKAQNMSNNAGVTPDGLEMGRAQVAQADAAGIAPHTDMNPVLLKPEGDRRSQIVLNGRSAGHLEARNWRDIKRTLWEEVRNAYDRLKSRYDVVILEGAGSPAEINLKDADIVNLGMARHASSPCLLIGDIDRGGVFAALAGTVFLLDDCERSQIRGFLINRFRGDVSLLGNATTQLRDRAWDIPPLGVIPWIHDIGIPEEDAVALERAESTNTVRPHPDALDLAILRLPRISNFDEFDALAVEPGVNLRFVEGCARLGDPDVILIPDTKSTVADLEWLRHTGLANVVVKKAAEGCEIIGLCGGLQMLGASLADPNGVEKRDRGVTKGLGLLGLTTTFVQTEVTERMTYRLATGQTVSGYEIHNGESALTDASPLGDPVSGDTSRVWSAVNQQGNVWGTYLHDIFSSDSFRHDWLRQKSWQGETTSFDQAREQAYDRLANIVKESVDWPAITSLISEGR